MPIARHIRAQTGGPSRALQRVTPLAEDGTASPSLPTATTPFALAASSDTPGTGSSHEATPAGPAAFSLDRDGVVTGMTPAAEKLLGWTAAECLGHLTPLAWLDPTQVQVLARERAMAPEPSILFGDTPRTWTLTGRDGSRFDAVLTVTPLAASEPSWLVIMTNGDQQGSPAAGTGSTTDPLTGLATRAEITTRLTALLADPQTPSVGVILLDLDGFRILNGSLGVEPADEVLRIVSQRLLTFARAADLVARVGADEFAIVIGGVHTRECVLNPVRHLERLLANPMRINGQEIHVTASIGVAIATRGRSAGSVLREAEVALVLAQEKGHGATHFFDEHSSRVSQRRVHADATLRTALAEDRLRVHYQPVIDLSSGAPVGAEALLRLDDPERGLLGPAPYVAAAEESGLIVPVGRWVLEQACSAAAAWNGPAQLSVNLSARQVNRPDLVETVVTVLERTSLPPERLCLELTETALAEAADSTAGQLQRLRGLGVQLAIDDFGTGWSSLTYLRKFPVSILKIDRSFVAGLVTDSGDRAIVTAVIRLSQALDLVTIAEGVENDEQLAALQDLGCDQAQGFGLGRPAATVPF
jgi:diguanylate cyclase (GGDEF)-like protein